MEAGACLPRATFTSPAKRGQAAMPCEPPQVSRTSAPVRPSKGDSEAWDLIKQSIKEKTKEFAKR
jgi:hypothetical protein